LVSPIAWPIAKTLDIVLGSEHRGGRYSKAKLKAAVAVAAEADDEDVGDPGGIAGGSSQIRLDEVKMVHGVMDLSKQKVRDHMVHLAKVKMLSMADQLDIDKMAEVYSWGHSRLPVYDGETRNIRGILIIKKCVVLEPEDCRKIKDLGLRKPLLVAPTDDLHEVLQLFVKKQIHQAIVTDNPERVTMAWAAKVPIPSDVAVLGIITMEDVIEELIKEEIQDEATGQSKPPLMECAEQHVVGCASRNLHQKHVMQWLSAIRLLNLNLTTRG
jgi:metal transporter CNNM